jgi:hypothetical protein
LATILYPQGMSFAGLAGIITALGVFLVLWLIVFLRTKGKFFTFDPGGNDGEFGKTLLPMYLDIAKFVLGLAAASIVFCLFGSSNFGPSAARPLSTFASPLFLVAMSFIYGVLFMIFLVLNYEAHRSRPDLNSYTRFKYTRNQAFGFSALACFCAGYTWLVVAATR